MELQTPPHIEIRPPHRFNFPFVVLANAFSIVFALMILVSIGCIPLMLGLLAAIIMGIAHASADAISLLNAVVMVTMWISLPVAVLVFGIFLPLALANPLVKNLCATMRIANSALPQYCVQITFEPRERRGIRSFLEDADDIGVLRFERDSLAFEGDSISFAVPYPTIADVRRVSTGWRGCFLLGKYIRFDASSIGPYRWITIGERESNLLTTSRKLSRAIFYMLSEQVNAVRSDAAPNS
ncbi:MAG: hypothetical protein IT366_03120 [Candidatus Hydrogenedentes bacterium]|nr:hypothetical protein [Candidatus Hydrogenedentota bacterium]